MQNRNSLPNDMTQYQYLERIRLAKLELYEKQLMYFYATTFNWKNRQPSRYATRTICSLTSMAQSTYDNARKRLVELGWIKIKRRGDQPTWVYPQIGKDDEDYEARSWAKWHPSNRDTEEPPSLEEFLEDAEGFDADE